MLKIVQLIGSVSNFARPARPGHFEMAVLIFAYAERAFTFRQLGYISGLLIGPHSHGSTLHTVIKWGSELSRRPVKSFGSAEIIAVGPAIDQRKLITNSYKVIMGVDVHFYIGGDTKDLFHPFLHVGHRKASLFSPTSNFCTDVQLWPYNFEMHNLNLLI